MKKLVKILLWAAGVFAALVIVLIVGLKLFFPTEKVRAMAEEKGSAAMGRQLTVGGLDLSFWGGLGVRLKDVKIANPAGMEGPDFLAADGIDLKLRILPLISGDVRVSRLIIESPAIRMHKFADGSNNYSFAAIDTVLPPEAAQAAEKMTPEGKTAAAAISFDALEIEKGAVTYRDDSTNLSLDLSALNLSTSLDNPRTGYYVSAGRLNIGDAKLKMEEPYPSLEIGLNYRVAYDMDSNVVAIERADLDLNGLRFDLSGRIVNPLDTINAAVSVKTDRVTVSDLFKLLPPAQLAKMSDYSIRGDVGLNADIEYNAAKGDSALYYTGVATLTDVAMSSKEIDGELKFKRCLIDFQPASLRMNLEDGSFDNQPFKGHLLVENFDNPQVSGELAGGLDLAFVEPFLPPADEHKLGGKASFNVKFAGPVEKPETMDFSGDLKVTDGRYQSMLTPEPMSGITLDAYFEKRLVNIRQLDCKFPSGKLAFTGRMTDLVPYLLADSVQAKKINPSFEGDVKGTVDVKMAQGYLPPQGGPKLSGRASLDLKVMANLNDLSAIRPRGSLTLDSVAFADTLMLPEPIQRLDATLQLRPDTIELKNFDVTFPSSDVHLAGRLTKPFPYLLPLKDLDRNTMPKPMLDFTMTSHRFDTDKLFPEVAPGVKEAEATASATVDSLPSIILPDIEGRGTAHADTVMYMGMEITQADAKVKIHDLKLECYDVKASVYTGTMTGNTTIDLGDFNRPRYTGEVQMKQIEADDFARRFQPKLAGHVFGKADFSGSFDCIGWDPDELIKSLTMNGSLSVRDGRLVTSGGLNKGLNALAGMFGTSIDENQPLKGFVTPIKVENGRLSTDNLTGKLGFADFTLKGSLGLLDNSLDYGGNLLLTKEFTDKITSGGSAFAKLAALAVDKNTGRLPVPLSITGPTDNPVVKIDQDAITKMATQNAGEDVKKKVGDFLNGLIPKKK